jgi:uncharacterized protein (DUF488 family)
MHVYPLGYSVPGASEHLDALMQDEKMVLVDTRLSPRSRWQPQWNKKALQEQYRGRYLWLGATLGNKNYNNGGPIKLADPDNPTDGIARLVTGLQKGYSLVLLCACKDYGQCHRKVICELLHQAMPEVEICTERCHCCEVPVSVDESVIVGEGNERYRLCYLCCK